MQFLPLVYINSKDNLLLSYYEFTRCLFVSLLVSLFVSLFAFLFVSLFVSLFVCNVFVSVNSS